jgi:hypothetical protein
MRMRSTNRTPPRTPMNKCCPRWQRGGQGFDPPRLHSSKWLSYRGGRGIERPPVQNAGAATPPRYANASSIAAPALRQDVRVDIERDSYAGVSQVSGARFMPIAPQSDLEDDQHPVDQEGVGVGSDLRRDPASQPHKVLANDVSLWLHPITTSKGEQPGVLLSSTHHPNHFSRVGRDQSCGCVNRAR